MNIKGIVGGGIIGLAWTVASILGLVIHVWTILIASSLSGFFAAVLTFVFPVLSEIYWFFVVGSNIGFGTTYCVLIIAWVSFFGIASLGAMIASRRD